MALLLPTFDLFDNLCAELTANTELRTLCNEVLTGGRKEHWKVADGLVTVRSKIYVLASSRSVPHILESMHGAVHEGTEKTLHRLWVDFHLLDARTLELNFIKSCAVCEQNKTKQLHSASLLQPLDLPSAVWADIAMNFMEGFPLVHGKSVILTVVDRFSKYAHFLSLVHLYTSTSVVQVFFDSFVWLHGIPSSIVSNMGPIFTSQFWRELFSLSGVKLNMSLTFSPLEKRAVGGD
jgi:hypothetical protein